MWLRDRFQIALPPIPSRAHGERQEPTGVVLFRKNSATPHQGAGGLEPKWETGGQRGVGWKVAGTENWGDNDASRVWPSLLSECVQGGLTSLTSPRIQTLRMEPGSSPTSEFNRTKEPCTRLDVTIGKLEQLGYWVESALARKPWVSICALALVFLAFTSVGAFRRPLWFDEILTRYIAALPTFGAICKALTAHTESSPPLFHLVSKLSGMTLGWSALGLRFPAIAGYLAMILCVYFVVSRYTGPLYAAVGALSSYLTKAPYYSTEARPYGLLLGLSCIALVCWQLAARHRFRWLAVAGLWLSLAAALGLQYYAVLSFAAIGLGELVRTWRTRHVDWLVWAALGLATAPLPFLLPLVRSNFVLKKGYFAPATLSRLVDGIAQFYLPMDGLIFAAFAVVAGTCIVVFSGRQAHPSAALDNPSVHEVAAWIALLLAPVEAFIMGRFITGVFLARYAIITVIGFSILLPVCLHRLFRSSRGAALAALFFLGLCFAEQYAVGSKTEDLNTNLAPWLRASDHSLSPIVVANPLTYLPLAYNADRALGQALIYIPDPQEALKYRGVNTPDYNLSGLRGIAPLNLPTYSSFVSSHPRFLVLWEPSPYDWIVPKLRETGAELRFCAASGPRVLFLVDFPATGIPTGDHRPNSVADMACDEKR